MSSARSCASSVCRSARGRRHLHGEQYHRDCCCRQCWHISGQQYGDLRVAYALLGNFGLQCARAIETQCGCRRQMVPVMRRSLPVCSVGRRAPEAGTQWWSRRLSFTREPCVSTHSWRNDDGFRAGDPISASAPSDEHDSPTMAVLLIDLSRRARRYAALVAQGFHWGDRRCLGKRYWQAY